MKGRFEVPLNMAIMMTGIIGVVMLVVLIYWGMATNAKIIESDIKGMNSIDASHIIENCFKNDKEVITKEFLDNNNKKDLCEVCGICEILVEAEVVDMESEDEWKFKYGEIGEVVKKIGVWIKERLTLWKKQSPQTNDMMISIAVSETETHVGRLYVKV